MLVPELALCIVNQVAKLCIQKIVCLITKKLQSHNPVYSLSMPIMIREVDANNFEEVYTFNLFHEYSFRDSSDEYIADTEEQRLKHSRNIVERILKGDQKYHCLAAFDQDTMIAIHFLDRYEIDKQLACHIHGLWVHKDYRNQGLGKKLKNLGEVWAKKMGCKFMDSNVRAKNKEMISLNENLGYLVARLNFRKNLTEF